MIKNSNYSKENVPQTLEWTTAFKYLNGFDAHRHAHVCDRIYDPKGFYFYF